MKRQHNLYKSFLRGFILIITCITLFQSCENKVLVKSKKIDNTSEIKRLTVIADNYYDDLHKTDIAYFYFKKIIRLCDPKVNTEDYVDALTAIANIQQMEGDYVASEATATKAIPYLKNLKKPRFASNIYNQLGVNYTNTYDYDNAIACFTKALHLKTTAWRKSMALNNIAAVYMEQHKYQKAADLFIILSSEKYFSKNRLSNKKDLKDYARIIDNLSFCYYKLGDEEKAFYYCYKALKIRLTTEDLEGLTINYSHLSFFYQKNDLQSAKFYAKKAYEKACEINKIADQISSLNLLIKSSEGSDLRKYSLKHIELSDSLEVVRQQTKDQFALIKYDSKKDKEENLLLKTQKAENELQLERQKNRNIISYIIIVFIIGLLFFLSLYLSLKGKREKNETINKSETRISNKLHNELAIDVYNTLVFAESQDLELHDNKEKLLNNLDNIYNRTRNISKENSIIITNNKYDSTLKEMIAEFKTPRVNILVNGIDTIPWNQIDKNKKITIYRIIQELFINMKKHSDATLVSVIFKIIDQNITVAYTDNGVGVKNDRIILRNGLQNVENRIKTINGTIIFDANSDRGFKASFTFPI